MSILFPAFGGFGGLRRLRFGSKMVYSRAQSDGLPGFRAPPDSLILSTLSPSSPKALNRFFEEGAEVGD